MTSTTPDSSSKFGASWNGKNRSPRDVMDDFFGDALQGFGTYDSEYNHVRSNLDNLIRRDNDDVEDGPYNDEEAEDDYHPSYLPSVYSDDTLSEPSSSNVEERPALILALVDPPTRRFELLQLNIQGDKAKIDHLINGVIRQSAVDQDLAELNYEAICDYHAKIIDKSTRLIDLPCHSRKDGTAAGPTPPMMFTAATPYGDVHNGEVKEEEPLYDDIVIAAQQSEVLVAIPFGSSPIDCTLLARNVISHRRVINSLERRGIDTTPMLTLDSYSDDGTNSLTSSDASTLMTLSFASHHDQTQEQSVFSYAANLFIFEEQEANTMKGQEEGSKKSSQDILYDTLMVENDNKSSRNSRDSWDRRKIKWDRPICINPNAFKSNRVWRFEI